MKTFRRVLFWTHLVTGILVGIVVFIMSVTGVALTYQRQAQIWADGHEVEPPSEGAERLPLAVLLSTLRDERGANPSQVRMPKDPSRPIRVSFGRESVEVDPYTGEQFGAGAMGVRRMFRALIVWHRWLGTEGDGRAVGKAITGFSNLAFLFLVASGLYLWWPSNWSPSRLRSVLFFRRGLRTRARHFNWHNVFGFWLAIPLAIVVATGAFFSFSWPRSLIYAVTGEERPVRGPGRGASGAETPPPPDDFEGVDRLVERAFRIEPGWSLATLRFGPTPAEPLTIVLDKSPWGTRVDRRTTLVLDRATEEVIRRETPEQASPARKAMTWIRWLHTGEVFGFIGQTIAGLASLAGCFLVYTGFSLSWRRFLAWRARRLPRRRRPLFPEPVVIQRRARNR